MGRRTATALTVSLEPGRRPGGRFSRDQGTHGHSERHAHSLDRVGVSVNLVILPTDPRDDPGHGYQDANVDLDNQRTSWWTTGNLTCPDVSLYIYIHSTHHDDKQSRGHEGPDGAVLQ